jgi:hypothetical protein
MNDWQPIESAPKDGTEVLVHDEGAVVIAWWSEEHAAWMEHGPMKPPPQHWMPLPTPPKGEHVHE